MSEQQALLDRIYDDPSDLAARLVLADLLITDGDPYGEFIVLSCLEDPTPAQRHRRDGLRGTYWRKWLGRISTMMSPPVFEYGFVARCRLISPPGQLVRVLTDPRWRTVHTLALPTGLGLPNRFLRSKDLTALRTVTGITELEPIWNGPPTPWHTIGTEDLRALRGLPHQRVGLPALETLLSKVRWGPDAWAERAAHLHGIKTVQMEFDGTPYGRWLTRLPGLPFEEIRLRGDHGNIVGLHEDGTLRLTLATANPSKELLRELRSARPHVRRAIVRTESRGEPHDRTIRRILGAFEGLEVVMPRHWPDPIGDIIRLDPPQQVSQVDQDEARRIAARLDP